jgi:hypothetical protein
MTKGKEPAIKNAKDATMANDNLVADGVPMNLEQMREYLQDLYGFPCVMRELGTTTIKCPYCGKIHDHGPQPGHHIAGWV